MEKILLLQINQISKTKGGKFICYFKLEKRMHSTRGRRRKRLEVGGKLLKICKR